MQLIEKAFISDRAGITIVDFLADETLLSKAKIKDCMRKGGVWLKRDNLHPERIRKASQHVKLNDEIHLYFDEQLLKTPTPLLEKIEVRADLSLWFRPALKEELTLFSDHLSFERALEASLDKSVDCYHAFPIIPYVQGPIVLAHSNRAASILEESMIKELFTLTIKVSSINQDAFDEKLKIEMDSQSTYIFIDNQQDLIRVSDSLTLLNDSDEIIKADLIQLNFCGFEYKL